MARPAVTSSPSSGTPGLEGHLDLSPGPAPPAQASRARPPRPAPTEHVLPRARGSIPRPVGGWARRTPHPPPETFLRHS